MPGKRADPVRPPAESAIADWFVGADLVDAYAITLPDGAPDDIEALAREALEHPPAWFRVLLRLRDTIVSAGGVKSSRRIRQDAESEGRATVAFFPVLARSERELVLGEDDRHLDFRASVLVRGATDGEKRDLIMTTAVRCHNLPGRFYLMTIAPFHRLVVRRNLERLLPR
ncbi:hypothetical protein DUF2867 [Acidiphilium sp. JA12-A1]|nr:hypothetical protein DUF2867 [Acidiphilium sp. JA12-A1]